MRMKSEQNKKRRMFPMVLALVLAAVVAIPVGSGLARADETFSLNVTGGSADVISDLGKADMRIDLYKIADGEKDPAYDTWHWTLTGDFADALTFDEQTIDNAGYMQLAQDAANIAIAKKLDPAISQDAAGGKASFTNLEPGLYVILPRDASVTDDSDIAADGGQVQTIVNTKDWTYRFNPSITAVPSKMAKGGEPGVTPGEIGTAADYGPWLETVDVVLKPSVSEREGKIRITKTLLHYETKNPVTFVFSVEAVKEGETVYSDVVSMSFGDDTLDPAMRTNPGYDERIIDGIPIGARVTVAEIYPDPKDESAYYKLVSSDAPDVPVVTADEIIEFAFTNDYNDRYHGGGGAENRYVYVDDGAGAHWDTHQVINGQEVVKSEGQDGTGE